MCLQLSLIHILYFANAMLRTFFRWIFGGNNLIAIVMTLIMLYIPVLLLCLINPKKYFKLDVLFIFLWIAFFFGLTIFIHPKYESYFNRPIYGCLLYTSKKEQIDGVLAYASDPAAPTAAYVAEKLGLPGNPYDSVSILCNKDCFRHFLLEHGFNTPKAKGYSFTKDALAELGSCHLPIIIKPADSSGSKGTTVLYTHGKDKDAISFAFSFSRSHRIIIEEYIEKKHPYLIGGDIFVVNGKIVLWGLMNCHRDQNVNPLVPVGKSYPMEVEDTDVDRIKETLQRMVSELHIENGALNIELVIDKNGLIWPIDIGPRSGGNMIPELLGYIFGIDIPETVSYTHLDVYKRQIFTFTLSAFPK